MSDRHACLGFRCSKKVEKTPVYAFSSCPLDYSRSLLYGIADSQLRQLQSIQNAAAYLVTGMHYVA